MTREVIKSDCILCINSCGIDATVEDGKLVKVQGMKEHPISEGVLCPRGVALSEWVYSPDRLQYPMKKAGSGWERISWDEALDTTAEELQETKDKYGASALAVYTGSFGTENIELAAFADAVLKGEPYSIKGLVCTEGNPTVMLPDSARIREAMKALDFVMVAELFMTDTAKLADIVLPACSFLEKSGVGYVYGVAVKMRSLVKLRYVEIDLNKPTSVPDFLSSKLDCEFINHFHAWG